MSLGAFHPLLSKCAMHLTYHFEVLAPSSDLLVKSSGYQARRRRRFIASGCRINKTSQPKVVPPWMFIWPCIMNWLYINYQLDALIIIYS